MKLTSAKLVYFSPTGTTRKILEGIAKGMGVEHIESLDMTLPDAANKSIETSEGDMVVIGTPVYSGRVPKVAADRLKQINAKNTPAVLVVLYGNRAYEDALLELFDMTKDLGLRPVSGGAFIGEHSFSTEELPVASGRPDAADIEAAAAFGAAVRQKMEGIDSLDGLSPLRIPGDSPYRDRMPPAPVSPVTQDDICTTCGTCAEVCPVSAITVDDTVETDADRCILCCACVKKCPTGARIMNIPKIKEIAKMLNENFSARKEPETFI